MPPAIPTRSREELIQAFTLDRVGIAGGIYDPEKLMWMNGVYIRQLPLDELTRRTIPYLERPEAEGGLPDSIKRPLDVAYTTRVLQLEQERLKTLGEAAPRVAFFYSDTLTYDTALLIQKKMDAASTLNALVRARGLLATLKEWKHETMEPPMSELATQLGLSRGQLTHGWFHRLMFPLFQCSEQAACAYECIEGACSIHLFLDEQRGIIRQGITVEKGYSRGSFAQCLQTLLL